MPTASYRMINAAGHPLTEGIKTWTVEHRVLLYDRIGPGPHPCYWCGVLVTWSPGSGTGEGVLITDHVDRDQSNNAPDNLQPSCQSCNVRNSDQAVRDDEPYRVLPSGTRARGVRRTCEQCGAGFVTWQKPRPGRGRFCSQHCAMLWRWAAPHGRVGRWPR